MLPTERDDKYRLYLDRHRDFVLEEATKLDVRGRGLVHDLSKYSPEEFDAYADYFYGGHPRGAVPEHAQEAFDRAWLHHQHANDHHWQHHVLRMDDGSTVTLAMPEDAMREMLADWRGAGRAIMGDKAGTKAWYAKNAANMLLHPTTKAWIEANL